MLTAVARYALWVLIAASLSNPTLAEAGGERLAAPTASVGDAVFPAAVDPKYAKETPAKARVHTCVDQYNANKATNANGGMKWIEKGGGYFSECNKRLGGISTATASSQDGEEVERETARAREASYYVADIPVNRDKADEQMPVKCLYRNEEKLLCPGTDWIAFKSHYRTKDYDLLIISTGDFGAGNQWHDWKLIVEDGKKGIIKPLAKDCLACDIRVEKLNFQSNEIVFAHRQAKHLQTASFRAGQFTLRKSKLDPHEPLDEDTCGYLFGTYEGCRNHEITLECRMAPANSSHFALLRIEDQYAAISYEGMQRMCRAACSSGKAMDRTTFFKRVCRR